MDNLKKTISYRERCNIKLPSVKCSIRKRMSISSEQVVDTNTGRRRLVSKYTPIDNAKKLEKFKVTDFCIENLEAAGLLGSLTSTSLSHDVHTAQRNIENGIANLKTE